MRDQSILITGCSSGIGLASARAMAERGWRVFATAREQDDLDRLKTIPNVTPVALELRDGASIEACVAKVLTANDGKIGALFNNAGYAQPGAIEDVAVEHLREQFEVNVFGGHELIRRVLPAMRAAGNGRIVQCSSVLGFISAPFRGAYCASKFAMEGLTDALRLELRNTNIHVVLIEPGPIETKFVDRALEQAETTIDMDGSVHAEVYRDLLEKMKAGGTQTFKMPPEAVAAKLVMAVTEPRPSARYRITTPTHAAAAMKRVLPTSAMDWIAARN
ncbi:MAG: SDR family NAD(P)-dependent oxidoreductase [Pseudomonadota bacterium]